MCSNVNRAETTAGDHGGVEDVGVLAEHRALLLRKELPELTDQKNDTPRRVLRKETLLYLEHRT